MKTFVKWFILFVVAAPFVTTGCGDDYTPSPYGENDGVAPSPVSNIRVENINGGAILRYTLPGDPDLLYVKAVFDNSRGQMQEVRASMYVDTLVIEGIGNTDPREVKLYSVDHHENVSAPAVTTIEPLTPAVEAVYGTLSVAANFGGFLLGYENATRAALSFYVYQWDFAENKYGLHDVLTTEREEGTFTVKGYESTLQRLAICVRDKWDNVSDTLYTELIPINEVELDKTKFKLIELPGDVSWNNHEGLTTRLWDGQIGGINWGHTAYPIPFPHSLTIDLGTEAKLSQFGFWQRQDNQSLLYAHGCPRYFRIYGCEADKDYREEANWVLLFDGELERPSGGEFGDPLTQEDLEEAQRGHVFTMDQTAPYIRYFRFQSLMSWSGMETTVMAEITIWGNPDKPAEEETPDTVFNHFK